MEPSTAAASTNFRASRLQESNRAMTRVANAPGAGSAGCQVRHRSCGISDSRLVMYERIALGVRVETPRRPVPDSRAHP